MHEICHNTTHPEPTKALKDNKIVLKLQIEPESLELTADPDLIEQVIINLVKNAIEAVEGKTVPAIKLTAAMDGQGRTIIEPSFKLPIMGRESRKQYWRKSLFRFFYHKGRRLRYRTQFITADHAAAWRDDWCEIAAKC